MSGIQNIGGASIFRWVRESRKSLSTPHAARISPWDTKDLVTLTQSTPATNVKSMASHYAAGLADGQDSSARQGRYIVEVSEANYRVTRVQQSLPATEYLKSSSTNANDVPATPTDSSQSDQAEVDSSAVAESEQTMAPEFSEPSLSADSSTESPSEAEPSADSMSPDQSLATSPGAEDIQPENPSTDESSPELSDQVNVTDDTSEEPSSDSNSQDMAPASDPVVLPEDSGELEPGGPDTLPPDPSAQGVTSDARESVEETSAGSQDSGPVDQSDAEESSLGKVLDPSLPENFSSDPAEETDPEAANVYDTDPETGGVDPETPSNHEPSEPGGEDSGTVATPGGQEPSPTEDPPTPEASDEEPE